MPHYREQIRKAVVTAVTGLGTTGANVKDSPVFPLPENTPPTLCIYARASAVDYAEGQLDCAPMREVQLTIEGYAKTNNALADTLDDIASEVETAIFNDASLIALCPGGILLSDQVIAINAEGDEPLGKIEMNYLFYYHGREGEPNTKV